MKKNISRLKRIYYKNKIPYIKFKNKFYSVEGSDVKKIIKLIKRLQKKYNVKKVGKDKEDEKKNKIKNITDGITRTYISAGDINNINKDLYETKRELDKKINTDNNEIKSIEYKIDKLTNEYEDKIIKYKKNNNDDNKKLKDFINQEGSKLLYNMNKLKKDVEELKYKDKILLNEKNDIIEDNNNLNNAINDININQQEEQKEEDFEDENKGKNKGKNKGNKGNKGANTGKKYNTKKKQEQEQKQEQEKINLLKSKEKEIKPIEEVNFDDEQGNGKIKGGLYDNQIDHIMKNINTYLKTISYDELPDLIDYIIENKIYKGSFILNLSKRGDNKGYKHWIAIYYDVEEKNKNSIMSVCYYDSYGEKPNEYIEKQLKKMIDGLDISYYVKYKYNLIKNQNYNSSLCGVFAISFILRMLSNLDFKQSTDYKIMNDENMKEKLQSYNKFNFI